MVRNLREADQNAGGGGRQEARNQRWADSDSFRERLKDRRNRRAIPHPLETASYVPVHTAADTHDGQWKVAGKRKEPGQALFRCFVFGRWLEVFEISR